MGINADIFVRDEVGERMDGWVDNSVGIVVAAAGKSC